MFSEVGNKLIQLCFKPWIEAYVERLNVLVCCCTAKLSVFFQKMTAVSKG